MMVTNVVPATVSSKSKTRLILLENVGLLSFTSCMNTLMDAEALVSSGVV